MAPPTGCVLLVGTERSLATGSGDQAEIVQFNQFMYLVLIPTTVIIEIICINHNLLVAGFLHLSANHFVFITNVTHKFNYERE